MNAPLVPEPSSLDVTEISFAESNEASVSPLASVFSFVSTFPSSSLLPQPAAIAAVIDTTAITAKNFFIFIRFTLLQSVLFFILLSFTSDTILGDC